MAVCGRAEEIERGDVARRSCMLFGLTEVALPPFSEDKRVQTLIQLLIHHSVGTLGGAHKPRPRCALDAVHVAVLCACYVWCTYKRRFITTTARKPKSKRGATSWVVCRSTTGGTSPARWQTAALPAHYFPQK